MHKGKTELSLAERRYAENEEFNAANVEEIRIKKNKAADFRKEHGYSLTFAKLMKANNCATADEWRTLRNAREKERKAKK